MSAIELYARPSPDFAAKVDRTVERLRAAADAHPGRIVQATSLGVEDMVLTHLIAGHHIPIAIGTLETGMLHAETVALIGRIEDRYGIAVEVYRPQADAVIDARGMVVLPGLVNTHHHFFQTLTRNLPQAQDAELFTWLRVHYPIWARLTPEAIYVSSKVSFAQAFNTKTQGSRPTAFGI